MIPTAPCKECIDRQLGCHGSCETYQAWQAEWKAAQAYLRNGTVGGVTGFTIESVYRIRKRGHRRK